MSSSLKSQNDYILSGRIKTLQFQVRMGQGDEQEKNSQDSESEYSGSDEEEGYIPRQVETMEQTELEISQPCDERTSVNRQEIRRYETRSRTPKDLEEVLVEKERVTLQNIKRRNVRESNSRKYEQGQVTVHDTIRNDERSKKKANMNWDHILEGNKPVTIQSWIRKNQRRESVQLVQKQPKECIRAVSANQVNVANNANLSEWNQGTDAHNQYGYQKDIFGVSRPH